jgi:hypothetical protein
VVRPWLGRKEIKGSKTYKNRGVTKLGEAPSRNVRSIEHSCTDLCDNQWSVAVEYF